LSAVLTGQTDPYQSRDTGVNGAPDGATIGEQCVKQSLPELEPTSPEPDGVVRLLGRQIADV
jgi:hypothetical protein